MLGARAPGPFCQSCGMPLEDPEDRGTEADGLMAEDYCRFCFQSGVFTEPRLGVEEMIGRGPDAEGRRRLIPGLKRWAAQRRL